MPKDQHAQSGKSGRIDAVIPGRGVYRFGAGRFADDGICHERACDTAGLTRATESGCIPWISATRVARCIDSGQSGSSTLRTVAARVCENAVLVLSKCLAHCVLELT